MRRQNLTTVTLALIASAALGVGPVAAACSDDIAALEKKLDAEGQTAGAASSSGQAAAADRGSKAKQAQETGTPVADLPKPPQSGDMQGAAAAAQAGGGGDKVMQAKVTLNDAKNAAKKGDDKACEDAVAKAKAQIGQ